MHVIIPDHGQEHLCSEHTRVMGGEQVWKYDILEKLCHALGHRLIPNSGRLISETIVYQASTE